MKALDINIAHLWKREQEWMSLTSLPPSSSFGTLHQRCQNPECYIGWVNYEKKACTVCDVAHCPACFQVVLGRSHYCNIQFKKNIERLMETTKPCPLCHERIYRVNANDDELTCTFCDIVFSWRDDTVRFLGTPAQESKTFCELFIQNQNPRRWTFLRRTQYSAMTFKKQRELFMDNHLSHDDFMEVLREFVIQEYYRSRLVGIYLGCTLQIQSMLCKGVEMDGMIREALMEAQEKRREIHEKVESKYGQQPREWLMEDPYEELLQCLLPSHASF